MIRKRTNAIIIHHSASSRDRTTIGDIRSWHAKKGFTDSAGHSGYHFFISSSGNLIPDRPIDDWGCQVKNWNDRSIGICLAGNFNFENPTQAQIDALKDILVKIVVKYNLKYWNIYGHRDIKRLFIFNTTATACPGDNLYSKLKELRLYVKKVLNQ